MVKVRQQDGADDGFDRVPKNLAEWRERRARAPGCNGARFHGRVDQHPAVGRLLSRRATSRLSSQRGRRPDLDLAGSGGPPVPLSPGDGEQDNPSWSPDGSSVAYAAADSEGNTVSGCWARCGSAQRRSLPRSPAISSLSPVKWAPTNDWIAFNASDGLSIVSPDGQSGKALTEDTWMAFEWSEDGRNCSGSGRVTTAST